MMTAHLSPGQMVLLHGGASGIGTHAIQVAHALGCRVAVTAGSAEKLAVCVDLGADVPINYRDEDFVERVKAATDGAGADVILDLMGASYLDRNVDALAPDGRLVDHRLPGRRQGGVEHRQADVQARRASSRRRLRSRPVDGPSGKGAVVAEVVANVWPMIADGRVRPIVGAELPIQEAAEAHRLL